MTYVTSVPCSHFPQNNLVISLWKICNPSWSYVIIVVDNFVPISLTRERYVNIIKKCLPNWNASLRSYLLLGLIFRLYPSKSSFEFHNFLSHIRYIWICCDIDYQIAIIVKLQKVLINIFPSLPKINLLYIKCLDDWFKLNLFILCLMCCQYHVFTKW